MAPTLTSETLASGLRERLGNRVVLQRHQTPPWESPTDPTPDAAKGWVLLAGRGAGKSFATMWDLHRHMSEIPNLRARVIAPTLGDGIAAAVEGPNGLLTLSKGQARWLPSAPGGACVRYPNGSRAWIIGTPTEKDVDRLRALTNIDYDVFEEFFANPSAATAFQQASLSRRRGVRRFVVSSTPRPHPLIKDWEGDDGVVITRGTSRENKYIPLDWLHTLETMYKGTRLYRQEVLGEVIEEVEGALWSPNDIERSRLSGPASAVAGICDRIAVGVDPPTGPGTCGIVVVGQDSNGHLYVLDDRSVEEASPHQWAARVQDAVVTYDAVAVAEINQGGQMVKEVLNSAEHDIPIHTVNATKSKKTRAEPIALLWEVEEQIVHMVTQSTKLIDQMCHPAGTMITTRRGQVPIEKVRPDDEVLTREGFAPLAWAGQTGETDTLTEITHSNGSRVRMTACHPVWNPKTSEFVDAANVKIGDTLFVLPVQGRRSRQKDEFSGAATGTSSTKRSGTTSADGLRTVDGDRSSSTERSTRPTSGLSPRGSSSTTRTTPETTTNPRTSLRFPGQSTTMKKATALMRSVRTLLDSLSRSAAATRKSTSGRSGSPRTSPAPHVEALSSPSECGPSSVRRVEKTTTLVGDTEPVYNLQVADPWPHEFFADGVLVHNCEWVPNESPSPDRVDALVWACWFLRSRHTATVRASMVPPEAPVSMPSALSSVRMGRF